MKYLQFVIFSVFAALLLAAAPTQAAAQGKDLLRPNGARQQKQVPAAADATKGKDAPSEDVRISVAASRDTLGAGSGSDVLFTFSAKKGLHVNAVPPMSVKFDSSSPAVAGGNIVIPADTTTGRLESSLPVRLPFTLSGSAPRGRVEVRGVLTYYYCSDAEGWCRKDNFRFSFPVTVK